mmetsp:Transcript_29171/g.86363  ORF Transcript_29171/g.86363 Transcript_29171/m.86363 type:complete len:121 (+) Transcript_29171:999-1361(+)
MEEIFGIITFGLIKQDFTQRFPFCLLMMKGDRASTRDAKRGAKVHSAYWVGDSLEVCFLIPKHSQTLVACLELLKTSCAVAKQSRVAYAKKKNLTRKSAIAVGKCLGTRAGRTIFSWVVS